MSRQSEPKRSPEPILLCVQLIMRAVICHVNTGTEMALAWSRLLDLLQLQADKISKRDRL